MVYYINRIKLQEVARYIQENLEAPLHVEDLARKFGCSRATLQRSFKAHIGVPVYTYILKRRMEKAAELLLADNYTVAEVYTAVGYDSYSAFAYAFKKVHGVLPKDYMQTKP